ncbi:MAG: Rossmann-like and DUF2520 domain-containing protein [Flavobacteriales bacterium]
MAKQLSIVLIGSGHAALALGLAFQKKHQVIQVVARNEKKAASVAKKIACKSYGIIAHINKKADVYILCVKDDAIASLSKKIPPGGTVIHLSGATSIGVLNKHQHAGVAWPVRSLAGLKPVDWKKIHVLYEASSSTAKKHLQQLFTSIGSHVHYAAGENRVGVHMSIVVLNNFIHHLAFKGKELLKKYGFEKALYEQILVDEFEKIVSSDLRSTQTGPARRNDKKVIAKQIQLLKNDPEFRNVYKTITKSIIKTYSHE